MPHAAITHSGTPHAAATHSGTPHMAAVGLSVAPAALALTLARPAPQIGEAGFTPDDIAGLQLWLEADALGLNNNDPVGTWTDSSGLGNSPTQTTAGNKPLFKTNIFGSLPSVLFDGTDDWMNLPLTLGDSKTIFVVYKLTTVPSSSFHILFGIKSSVPEFSDLAFVNFVNYSNITIRHDCAADGNAVGYSPTPDTSAHILCHTYNNGTNTDPASYTIAQEGAQTVGTSSSWSRTTSNKGALGALVTSGDAPSSPFAGHVGELIVYDTVLSTTDRNLVGNYLERWGPTWTDV
jgi:hypothetical protein